MERERRKGRRTGPAENESYFSTGRTQARPEKVTFRSPQREPEVPFSADSVSLAPGACFMVLYTYDPHVPDLS